MNFAVNAKVKRDDLLAARGPFGKNIIPPVQRDRYARGLKEVCNRLEEKMGCVLRESSKFGRASLPQNEQAYIHRVSQGEIFGKVFSLLYIFDFNPEKKTYCIVNFDFVW